MALRPLQPARLPIGQFDVDDNVAAGLLGGECLVPAAVAYTNADKAAKDAFDGYAIPATPSRIYFTRVGNRSTDGYTRPLFLADEGVAGYGTLFGTVVGATAGQTVTGGTVLGPSTLTGSGKVTLWGDGLYAISIDALDATLQPAATLTVGAKVYATINSGATGGILTATPAATTSAVGNFLEFCTNGSLVSTPANLAGTFSAPDGAFVNTSARTLTHAVIHFAPNEF